MKNEDFPKRFLQKNKAVSNCGFTHVLSNGKSCLLRERNVLSKSHVPFSCFEPFEKSIVNASITVNIM